MTLCIRLVADYGCSPLWELHPTYNDEIDPESLPLKQETIRRLHHWADVFDDIINIDDPASSGFKTEQEEEDWKQEGVLLWKQLQQELGPEYKVYGHILGHSDDFASSEELEQLFPGKYTKTTSPYSSDQFEE